MKTKIEKIKLKELPWSEVILYFLDIREKEKPTTKDISDYFHFRYLTGIGLEKWTSPIYQKEKAIVEKLLRSFDEKMSLELIDVLFDNYSKIYNRKFEEIWWNIGILTSEKCGWVQEKIMIEHAKLKSNDIESQISRIVSKPRKDWTTEEIETFQTLMRKKGELNGKTTQGH